MPGQKTETNRRTLRTLAGALLLVGGLAFLAGCSSSQAADQPATVQPATAATTAETAAAEGAEGSPAATPSGSAPEAGHSPLPAATPPAPETLPADAHPTALVAPKLYTYRVVNVYPHDEEAFTQGLIVRDGQFLEGTGNLGQSTLRRVEIESGRVLQSHQLADQYFGEGITELDGKIYQLTWRNGQGFIYDAESLAPVGEFQYGTEGWGITHDGTRLIVSDGSSLLQFWDPATLQMAGGVHVSLFGLPMSQLNELEYIDGEVFANIWQTNLLVRIDPASGQVKGVVDLAGLLDYAPSPSRQPDVLNGIAYDEATGRLFVTGKLWPAVFEIELLEVQS